MASQSPDADPDNRGVDTRRISPWLVGVVLVVCGVIIARVVRAALTPALQPKQPISIEMHLV
jgi:hypothetical protein